MILVTGTRQEVGGVGLELAATRTGSAADSELAAYLLHHQPEAPAASHCNT
jgi:hypothetical protein